MESKIYQLVIFIKNLQPKIWRRILIVPDILLSDFHKVIQTVMGWENTSLHQFIKDDKYYMDISEKEENFFNKNCVDYKKYKLADFLKHEKDVILYEYNFNDSWVHEIILEKILAYEKDKQYPLCTGGKMSCPPEDCGGVSGYSHMLDVLNNPNDPEYEDYIEWLGEEFDPEYFDKEDVNRLLRTPNYGCAKGIL